MPASQTAEKPRLRAVQKAARERLQRARGSARISFKPAGHRSVVDELYQSGCLKARLPRNIDHRVAQAVLVNTSGGLTDGDRLNISCCWQKGTSACVTTQACERVYMSRGEDARISTKLVVAGEAEAFWLPQETIIFHGGRLHRSTHVELETDARLLACEAVILGRPAMGEDVRVGHLRDKWTVHRAGKRVFIDSLELDGDIAARLDRAGTGAGARAFASVIVSRPDLEAAKATLTAPLAALPIAAGCSNLGDVLLVRLLAPNGYQLRNALVETLLILGGDHALPKVWSC